MLERRPLAKRKVKEENEEILNSDHNRDDWQDRHAPAFRGVWGKRRAEGHTSWGFSSPNSKPGQLSIRRSQHLLLAAPSEPTSEVRILGLPGVPPQEVAGVHRATPGSSPAPFSSRPWLYPIPQGTDGPRERARVMPTRDIVRSTGAVLLGWLDQRPCLLYGPLLKNDYQVGNLGRWSNASPVQKCRLI